MSAVRRAASAVSAAEVSAGDRSASAALVNGAPTGGNSDPFRRWTELQLGCPIRSRRLDPSADEAVWERLAERYDAESSLAEAAPELVDWVASHLGPDDDVLDVGAGTGAFALPLAVGARAVTAVEPSAAMVRILTRKRDEAGLLNVRVVRCGWESLHDVPHAVALSVNALYRTLDVRSWLDRMHAHTRRDIVVILTDGREPAPPPALLDVAGEQRLPPSAGPAELETIVRLVVGPENYERREWRVQREYVFRDADEAVARLLGPIDLTPEARALAREIVPTVTTSCSRGLVLARSHRVVGLRWSPPR